MPCLFFKKKSKPHRVPPPTLTEVNGVTEKKTERTVTNNRYTVNSSSVQSNVALPYNSAIIPPPLPDRNTGDAAQPLPNGNHQPLSINGGGNETPTMRRNKPKPPPLTCSSKQLSQEILETPVPASAKLGPELYIERPSLSRVDSEDYIEPVKDLQGHGAHMSNNTVTSPSKVSLSDGHKTDILNEYFSQPMPKLNTPVPCRNTSSSSDESGERHEYTNVQHPDSFVTTPTVLHKPIQRLSREVVSPLPSPRQDTNTSVSCSRNPSDTDSLKAHSRRPKPVPRNGASASNSRKQSLASETDDPEFDYENVGEVVQRLDIKESGSRPVTPKPLPRLRTPIDPPINSQIPIQSPTSSHTSLGSPIACHGTYVTDAGYMAPGAMHSSKGNSAANSPSDTPNRLSPRHSPRHSPSSHRKNSGDTLPRKGNVDLSLQITKHTVPPAEKGLQGTYRKGYLPMDQHDRGATTTSTENLGLHNPERKGYLPMNNIQHTQGKDVAESESFGMKLKCKVPLAAGPTSASKTDGYITVLEGPDSNQPTPQQQQSQHQPLPTANTGFNLNFKVPAASAVHNKVKSAGYLAVLSDPVPAAASSKHQYYNINQQHSDYYNDPNILNQEKPQNNNPYWAQAESVDDGVYY